MWGNGNENGYHDGWGMMGGAESAFGWVMMTLVVLALVGAIIAIILVLRQRPAASTAPGAPAESTATRALDDRFARGEIDEAEYRLRRSVLLGS
jgi:putative membrane protein